MWQSFAKCCKFCPCLCTHGGGAGNLHISFWCREGQVSRALFPWQVWISGASMAGRRGLPWGPVWQSARSEKSPMGTSWVIQPPLFIGLHFLKGSSACFLWDVCLSSPTHVLHVKCGHPKFWIESCASVHVCTPHNPCWSQGYRGADV